MAFLSKYDKNMVFQWVKTWGPVGFRVHIAADENGDVLVAGDFDDIVDFDPDSGLDQPVIPDSPSVYVNKIDQNGNLIQSISWSEHDDGQFYNVKDVVCDDAGDVLIACDKYVGFAHSGNPQFDILIGKLDAQGSWEWLEQLGGPEDDSAGVICTDYMGSIYISGTIRGEVDFHTAESQSLYGSPGDESVFLCKYDQNGEAQWARTWAENENSDRILTDMSITEAMAIYLMTSCENQNGNRSNLRKLNIDGTQEWFVEWLAGGSAVEANESGGIFVTGNYENGCDLDPGNNVRSFRGSGSYLSEIGDNGDLLDINTWDFTSISGSCTSKDGELLICGSFLARIGVPPGVVNGSFSRTMGLTAYIAEFDAKDKFHSK
jgi:hypothetical protein